MQAVRSRRPASCAVPPEVHRGGRSGEQACAVTPGHPFGGSPEHRTFTESLVSPLVYGQRLESKKNKG